MNVVSKIKKKIFNSDPSLERMRFARRTKEEMYAAEQDILDLEVSDEVKQWSEILHRDGVVKIENRFDWVAEHFNKNYLGNESNPYILKDLIDERAVKGGRTYSKAVSLKDPDLEDWYFNEDLISLVAKEFKQQPYFRNQPSLHTHELNETHTEDMQGMWHLDGGLNQVAFMLLLNDLTEDDTHMLYALRSNHEEHTSLDRYRHDVSRIESEYEIMKCIGKAGTLFIFHAGIGYHRAVYKHNTVRKMFHCIFTPGHDIKNLGFETSSNFPDLSHKSPIIQKSVSKILN